jgi:hypothetical protein
MFLLIFLLQSKTFACPEYCRLKCTIQDFPSSCLSSCGCSQNTALEAWDCPGETLKLCEKASNIEKCLKKFNCKSKALVITTENSSNKKKQLKNTQNFESLKEKPQRKVTCEDCEILEGDDYWECLAEYCEASIIELKKCDCKAGDLKCRKNCSNRVLPEKDFETSQLKRCSDCSPNDLNCIKTCTYDIAKVSYFHIRGEANDDGKYDEVSEFKLNSMNFLSIQQMKLLKNDICIQKCCKKQLCDETCVKTCEQESYSFIKTWPFFLLIIFPSLYLLKNFLIFLIKPTSKDHPQEYLILR